MAKKQDKNDILSLIKADHQKVQSIFHEMENMDDMAMLYEHFNLLYKEINLHAEAEELVFYPAMRDFEETEDFIEEAEEEHEEAEIMLEEIRTMEPGDPEFKQKLQELQEAMMHHIQEEEGEIFEAVKGVMGEKELKQLGEEFIAAKSRVEADVEEAMSR
ncbi:MAG: hemerythrin domain-containing protein [Leptolyngbyaceae cyanobacterium bins.59]|nr:hemerythrin domain-containing protein [Leptolyngbyaceae cyanobacterium bins.59]